MENYERIDKTDKFDGKVRDSHEYRYKWSNKFIKKTDNVLDAGCGVGYAKDILNGYYLGIDRNPVVGDSFLKFDFEEDGKFTHITRNKDVFVGMEIIEHLNDIGIKTFVYMAKQSKKYICISTPIIRNSNPYHKQQFTKQDIVNLFGDDDWVLDSYEEQSGVYGLFAFKRK